MDEPMNYDHYYISVLPGEKDGKKGKVKTKVWVKNGVRHEKIIAFTPHPWEVENEVSDETA